ncbi:MAG: DUF3883 domain-containing protein [Microbacterium sp.]
MIEVDSLSAFDAGFSELRAFGEQHSARGRFIALYLGLRLMGDLIAPLGSGQHTSTSEIEQFMDRMWTKTHRSGAHRVLTAPFGGGGAHGGYSTATGEVAPGNTYPTNTWRNNLNSQKGIGCVAPPTEIARLVEHDDPRAACPHYAFDGSHHYCAISGARYRGEQHTIWLGREDAGFQVVDLDRPSVFEPYLRPGGARIPVHALIATLYCFAPSGVYPARREVSLVEFESDFGLAPEFTRSAFDCDPASPANARTLRAAARSGATPPSPTSPTSTTSARTPTTAPLPPLPEQIALNSGVQAEIAVGEALQAAGWRVYYTGGQRLLGYDLRAESADQTLHVEVKSSVGYVTPTLTESEWNAANIIGDAYLLAVVDFVGTSRQAIRFLRDPARHLTPVEKQVATFRLPRGGWTELASDAAPDAGSP